VRLACHNRRDRHKRSRRDGVEVMIVVDEVPTDHRSTSTERLTRPEQELRATRDDGDVRLRRILGGWSRGDDEALVRFARVGRSTAVDPL